MKFSPLSKDLTEVKEIIFISGVLVIFLICFLFVIPMLRLIYV